MDWDNIIECQDPEGCFLIIHMVDIMPVSWKPTVEYVQLHCSHCWFLFLNTQAISTDTRFEVKMMVKIYAIEIIFRSHEPFQSYLLTGQADSAKKAG